MVFSAPTALIGSKSRFSGDIEDSHAFVLVLELCEGETLDLRLKCLDFFMLFHVKHGHTWSS